ncbi:MAG TPA: cupin domain-containing protein [Alphaproteobacteria bacterium]|nr:cupin domain-containing protein [Alphaproteobacteria bacterium]
MDSKTGRFETRRVPDEHDVIAPDGSEVRILCGLPRGGMALFTLPPNAVARGVVHRTVEEIWYFASGRGRMWRAQDDHQEIVEVGPGVSISIPVGTRFQFRCDGAEPLVAVGVTMPPWPGEGEAQPAAGPWAPTV